MKHFERLTEVAPKGTSIEREESASSCGQIIIYLSINGVFSRGRTCKNWACTDCIEIKVNDVIECLEQNITGPHVFLSKIWLTKKRLSNWVDESKPREVPNFFYYAFQRGHENTLLISSHSFPIEYKQRSKIRCLKELRAYLLEHHTEIERTSRSITSSNPEKEPPFFLAKLPKNFDKESEYKKLRTDREIAEWLYVNRGRIGLHYMGRQFIREHLGEQAL
jgi:hypothetical protein